MDVASRNIVEGHTRKGLQILGSNNLMSSVHHQTLVIPNGGWTRINLLLLLVWQARPFNGSKESSTEVVGESVLVVSVTETMGVTETKGVEKGPFSMMHTVFFLMLDNGSSFFDLIFTYISLLNLVIISARSKHLLKKKKKEASTDEVNTYFFFPQSHGCAGQRQKAPVWGNKRREYVGPLDRHSFQ